jgi:hypothetical protein
MLDLEKVYLINTCDERVSDFFKNEIKGCSVDDNILTFRGNEYEIVHINITDCGSIQAHKLELLLDDNKSLYKIEVLLGVTIREYKAYGVMDDNPFLNDTTVDTNRWIKFTDSRTEEEVWVTGRIIITQLKE